MAVFCKCGKQIDVKEKIFKEDTVFSTVGGWLDELITYRCYDCNTVACITKKYELQAVKAKLKELPHIGKAEAVCGAIEGSYEASDAVR